MYVDEMRARSKKKENSERAWKMHGEGWFLES